MRLILPRLADRMTAGLFDLGEDFTQPAGEPSLVAPDSISWRVFGNVVTMYIGGIAAVLLELAEPRVRHGVWDHSSFRRDPAQRLRRTGLAAMITVYGARSQFEALASRVRRMHGGVTGATPEGQPYAANDPELLLWVQATAAFGFVEAYRRYASPLTPRERDLYYAEGGAGAALYGVEAPPKTEAALLDLFAAMTPLLGPSPILDELIEILSGAPILPRPLRWLQPMAVRAAADLLPPALLPRTGLERHARLGRGEAALLRALARGAEGLRLSASPREQALQRIKGMRRRSAIVWNVESHA